VSPVQEPPAAAYLARLGLDAAPPVDAAGLAILQQAHLVAVPFENLDVWEGAPTPCDEGAAIAKIVERRRGGWCFELNGAFAVLLERLGFPVTRVAATVLRGEPTPLPDHLTLVVALDRPYLVDVGFGVGTPRRPLPLDGPGPHDGGCSPFRLVDDGGTTILERRRRRDGRWERCFRLDEFGVALDDLTPSAEHLRSTPNLFTEGPFATRALDGGTARVTWNAGRLVVRRPGSEIVAVAPDRAGVMRRWFGFEDPYAR